MLLVFFSLSQTTIKFSVALLTYFCDREHFCFGPLFTQHLPSPEPGTEKDLFKYLLEDWQIDIDIYIHLYPTSYTLSKFCFNVWCIIPGKSIPEITTYIGFYKYLRRMSISLKLPGENDMQDSTRRKF